MSRLPFPPRAVWPKLLPAFSVWSTILGVVSFVLSIIIIGIADLSWWAKAGIILGAIGVSIFGLPMLKMVGTIYQRVKQYDPLYDRPDNALSNIQQLQANLEKLVLNLKPAAGNYL